VVVAAVAVDLRNPADTNQSVTPKSN
jgi:hypothetical protein